MENNKSIIAIVAVAAIIALGLFAFKGDKKQEAPAVVESTVSPTTAPAAGTSELAFEYKDGTYEAVGMYTSPGGEEQIGVTVTLKGDVIDSAEVKPMAERPASVKFQGIFSENYKEFVVGKKITEIKLDKVAGSSLSPKGFNDAIEKIKTEAKS